MNNITSCIIINLIIITLKMIKKSNTNNDTSKEKHQHIASSNHHNMNAWQQHQLTVSIDDAMVASNSIQ